MAVVFVGQAEDHLRIRHSEGCDLFVRKEEMDELHRRGPAVGRALLVGLYDAHRAKPADQ